MKKGDELCGGWVPISHLKDRPGLKGWHVLEVPGCDDLPENGGRGSAVLAPSVPPRRYAKP